LHKKCGRPHLKNPFSSCPKNVRTEQIFPIHRGRLIWTAPYLSELFSCKSEIARSDVRTILVKLNCYIGSMFSLFQKRGVEYYGIGVGTRSNENELLEIASLPKQEHKFHTNDYNGMQSIALKLRNLELCGNKTLQSTVCLTLALTFSKKGRIMSCILIEPLHS